MADRHSLDRRGFLKAAVVSALAFGIADMVPGVAEAQTSDTPQQALQRLVDGNKRYLKQRRPASHQDYAELRRKTAKKQEPFAAVLACADSRVPVELIFDQTIGDVFVTRVAGNIATPVTIATLEYGAAVLGTKVIMVLGHSDCGAVKATIETKKVPGQISALYSYIYPAVAEVAPDKNIKDINDVARKNAENQATLLREASPVLSKLVKKKELMIVPAFYDVATGVVTLLEV